MSQKPSRPLPAGYMTIDEFAEEWERGQCDAETKKARSWIADTFYGDDGDTVRTIRLRKGMSQKQLSKKLSIDQCCVEMIEDGSRHVDVETRKKLVYALEIDGLSLDHAIERQVQIREQRKQ